MLSRLMRPEPSRERLSSPQEMAWHRHALCKTKPLLPCRRANQMYLIVGRNNLTTPSSGRVLFFCVLSSNYTAFRVLALPLPDHSIFGKLVISRFSFTSKLSAFLPPNSCPRPVSCIFCCNRCSAISSVNWLILFMIYIKQVVDVLAGRSLWVLPLLAGDPENMSGDTGKIFLCWPAEEN